MKMSPYTTIEEYIANFPEETQKILKKMQLVIREAAPEAKEKIGYGIPTFVLSGNLVHFAGYDHHLGFYPGAEAVEVFAEDIKEYESSKGTIKFPLDKPIPYDLVSRITKYRVEQNQNRKQ